MTVVYLIVEASDSNGKPLPDLIGKGTEGYIPFTWRYQGEGEHEGVEHYTTAQGGHRWIKRKEYTFGRYIRRSTS